MTAFRVLLKATILRGITRQIPSCYCQFSPTQSSTSLNFNSSTSSSTSFKSIQSRSYASKKGKSSSSGKSSKQEEPEEEDYTPVKGKGIKKGKGSGFNDTSNSSSGSSSREDTGEGIFDLKVLERNMDESIEKLRINLKTVVGRVGRVSPDLLDSVKVEISGKRYPLSDYASVSVKDGKDLLVTIYEESSVPDVSKALYASSLSLTPQVLSPTTLKVPFPKPDWEKRQELVRKAGEICENGRVLIRSIRGKGMKDIKTDVDMKVVGKESSRGEVKKLDISTKKRTDEVDSIFEKAKKVLMDE